LTSQNKVSARFKGYKSEDYVCSYLVENGYEIITRNYTIRGSEIDVIARFKEWIVFIEIKSSRSNSHYSVYLSLNKTKKAAIKRGINLWLLKNNFLNAIWRFDLVILFTDSGNIEIYSHTNL
jgi:putative endonuclease